MSITTMWDSLEKRPPIISEPEGVFLFRRVDLPGHFLVSVYRQHIISEKQTHLEG